MLAIVVDHNNQNYFIPVQPSIVTVCCLRRLSCFMWFSSSQLIPRLIFMAVSICFISSSLA